MVMSIKQSKQEVLLLLEIYISTMVSRMYLEDKELLLLIFSINISPLVPKL